MSLSIDKTQAAIYILIEWKSNPALAWESKPRVSMKMLMWVGQWMFAATLRPSDSLLFFALFCFKRDDNNNRLHASLHKKHLTLIRIIPALCRWDGIEIPSRVSHFYVCWFPSVAHKHVTLSQKAKKATSGVCAVLFFSVDCVLRLFEAVGGRKSLFALRLLLHCVNC